MNHAAPLPEHELLSYLRSIWLGDAIELGDLTLVPILGNLPAAGLDLLEDAFARGTTRIHEVSQEGVVGRVRVDHAGSRTLLLLQGEQILGARQHRMLNDSGVVETGESKVVLVSCVERGRWREEAPGFRASETTLPPSIRQSSHRKSTLSMIQRGTPEVDQSEVWAGVRTLMGVTGTGSHTEAYNDVVEARRREVEARIAAVPKMASQVGLAALHDGRLVSVELLGDPDLFARARNMLLRGLFTEPRTPSLSPQALDTVGRTLHALGRLALQRVDDGAGSKLAAAVPWGNVSALGYRGTLVHALVTAA